MKEIKNFTKSTFIYFLGTVGAKMVSFLLLPLYTAYIAPEAYGTYDLNITYTFLFTSFFFLDIWCGIMKFIFEKQSESEKQSVTYNGIIIFATSAIIYSLALWIFGWYGKIQYLTWVILYGLFFCIQNLYGYLARSFGHNLSFAVSGIAATALTACVNIILLVIVGMDYQSLYISFIAGVLIQCIILEFKLKVLSNFSFRFLNRYIIKELLYFSLPLSLNELCYWFLTGYNRVYISRILDTEANGYYAVASKFGGILIIVSSCLNMAWQELAFGKGEKSEENGRFYSKATDLYLSSLMGGAALLLPIIYIAFPFLIDSEYAAAKVLIPINILATLASILYTFLGNIISTYKKNHVLFQSTLVACIVNIICLHLFVKSLGVEAANIALLAGYCVSDFMRIKNIKKIVPYHLNWKLYVALLPLIIWMMLAYWNNSILLLSVGFAFGIILVGIIGFLKLQKH